METAGRGGRARTFGGALSSWACGDRLTAGLPGLGRGPEGPAVFRALASPRKPPPNTIQTPRAGQMQGAQLSQRPRVIGAEPRAWLLELAKEGEESQVQLVQKPWPGWESQLRGEEAKPSIHSSGGHCPWRTGAGIRQGQGRNAGPGAGQRLHQAQCIPGGHNREGRVFWRLGENPGGWAPGARFMVGPPGFRDSASSLP